MDVSSLSHHSLVCFLYVIQVFNLLKVLLLSCYKRSFGITSSLGWSLKVCTPCLNCRCQFNGQSWSSLQFPFNEVLHEWSSSASCWNCTIHAPYCKNANLFLFFFFFPFRYIKYVADSSNCFYGIIPLSFARESWHHLGSGLELLCGVTLKAVIWGGQDDHNLCWESHPLQATFSYSSSYSEWLWALTENWACFLSSMIVPFPWMFFRNRKINQVSSKQFQKEDISNAQLL